MALVLLTVVCGELQLVGSVDFSTHLTHSKAKANVSITLLLDAVEKGAVCLDGSPPSYYLDRGVGSGSNKWVIDIEGGGWCNNRKTCRLRAKTRRGSSTVLPKEKTFSGILSSVQSENPDFYNWNRVKVSYCDGSSFTGDVKEVNQTTGYVYFRGQRIWQAVMEDLLAKGMCEAEEALLTGCSAGGLTTILHCDEFRALLPMNTKVKCLSDAGFFLNMYAHN
ncbi:hypothetical protein SUGI_0196240 [Cryptomeria japonica]|nr:hypothetical protein SUGI_0196240 [Cryptomeria japonica]